MTSVELPPAAMRTLSAPNLAYLATVLPDGSPHVAPLWVEVQHGLIRMNSAEGRTKVANIRRDPRVALAAHDRDHPWPPLVVRGTVVGITAEGAAEHIDALCRRYLGKPWEPVPGQQRLILEIRPDRIVSAGWGA